jgi:hypothetical protein
VFTLQKSELESDSIKISVGPIDFTVHKSEASISSGAQLKDKTLIQMKTEI